MKPTSTHCQQYDDQRHLTRRQWLNRLGYGLGGAALASLMAPSRAATAQLPVGPGALPHFAPKAKRVICLFMSGGFSQIESFDHKPMLAKHEPQPIPESIFKGRKPLGMSRFQISFLARPSAYPFHQHGQSGAWISDRFPHLAKHADKICFINSMTSEAVNHDPAIIYMNSGHQLPGRPTIGSWLSYGMGSENENLPAYIILVSKRPVDQPLSSRLWDSGFLPSEHQGVNFRPGNEPVLFLNNPPGISDRLNRRMLDKLKEVQTDEIHRRGESEITARIEQLKMAYKMQTSVPEVTDISQESPATLERYGAAAQTPGSYARNCMLARKLCEKGVRYVQLFQPGWDHHGEIRSGFKRDSAEIDQPTAALLQDLEERGLLEDTLVMFVTEFGRTCYSQGTHLKDPEMFGREHHRNAFSIWLAGAGIKPGITYGAIDEFGFDVADGKVTVNDLHATLLHLLGIQHDRFTFRFQGRDYRLTDVAGEVIKPILA